MAVRFDDVLEAYEFVAASPYDEHVAFVNRETGEILFWSEELKRMDEDAPEGVEDPDELGPEYVAVPGPRDPDLGTVLVRRFVQSVIPDAAHRVEGFFRRPGAYRRFRALLEERGLLDRWRGFRDDATRTALRAWCEEMGIEVEEG